jgi:hypothetical protein
MRSGAERANEARTLRVRDAFHNYAPTGLAQFVEHWLRRNDNRLRGLQICAQRLGDYFGGVFLWRALRPGTLRGSPGAPVRRRPAGS